MVRGGAVLGGSSILVMGWVRGSWWGLSCAVGGDGAWGISSSRCCGAFASCSSALMGTAYYFPTEDPYNTAKMVSFLSLKLSGICLRSQVGKVQGDWCSWLPS